MSQLIQKHKSLKEATEQAISETANFDGLAADILTEVAIQTINIYQQKLNVGVQDSVSDLTEAFKQKVSQAVFEAARGWRLHVGAGTFLFPNGCRFCFVKGASTVVVIEQEPQIRTLLFDSNVLGDYEGRNHSGHAERISLALPYVVFILHFKNGQFTSLYCGWRTLPLTTRNDALYNPLLPNIHENMNVCMGRDANISGVSICEQTASAISAFWNSRFNNDLSMYWWGKGGLDTRLRTARTWAAASLDDSTFMLNIDFGRAASQERNMQRVIDLLTFHEQEADENSLRHHLAETIDESVESLFAKIMRYFKKTRFDKYHPKDVKDALARAMKDANSELIDLIFAIQHELENLDGELVEDCERVRPVKAGRFWCDYST